MRKNSIKNTRLNEEVMRELSTIIRNEIKDPRIHPNLRNTPELRFILDESIEYGIEMSKKIDALTGGKEEE